MNDLEITRRCAEAMGLEVSDQGDKLALVKTLNTVEFLEHRLFSYEPYDPLHDDAQAMALVKAMRLNIECDEDEDGIDWIASRYKTDKEPGLYGYASDLNRAICLAVAQREKE